MDLGIKVQTGLQHESGFGQLPEQHQVSSFDVPRDVPSP